MFKRACILFAAVLPLFAAHAGERHSPSVRIFRPAGENPWATGSLSGTHNSADPSSLIRCTITVWPASTVVVCEARVSNSKDGKIDDSGSCSSGVPALVQAARSIGPTDIVSFGWDASGQCTMLEITKTSTVGSAAQAL